MDENESEPITITADEADAGERLDRFLCGHIADMSRSRLKALIKSRQVTRAGATIEEPNIRVKPRETYVVRIPPPEPAEPRPEDIPLDIAYEDEHLVVVDKPAGMVVHPAAGNWTGTLVNALLHHCGNSLAGVGGVRRPGIVHRLDKDTSGLIVVAKNEPALRGLARQFAAHGRDGGLERVYTALAWGVPSPRRGTIDANLARSVSNRTKIAVVDEGGRPAITHYEVVEVFNDAEGRPVASRLECCLETGRTHQIRVHMAHAGHPLLGDSVYGAGFAASARRLGEPARARLAALGRQALHAAVLGFRHPVTGKALRLESPLPAAIAALISALRGTG